MKSKWLKKMVAMTLSAVMVLPNTVFAQQTVKMEPTNVSEQQETKEGESPRTILNFNNDWGYYMGDLEEGEAVGLDDSQFANVTLPHTMRLEKKHAGDARAVYQGIGWYRRYLTLDKSYEGKRINIDFDGVMIDSDIYLNGEKIYTRNGGYIGFSVDITDKVKFGETNILAVRVSNVNSPDTPPGKPLENLDFHYYGGIYRDVRLRITENLHITDALQADEVASGGVFVTYPNVTEETATVNVKTHVENKDNVETATTVKNKLLDNEGNLVATAEDVTEDILAGESNQFTQEFSVENPNLWSPDTPYLYTLVSEVYNNDEKVDEISTRVGIRNIQMKADGCYVNGEKLYIRGANRHQSYAYIGDAGSDSMQVRDALQLKENGFNAVRATHYPQSPAFLDACDEVGLLVIECQPGWQNFTNTQTFYDLTLRDTREMIRRDRNRPSVFMWETSLNETYYSEDWAKAATGAAHEEYPGDQMFTAADYGMQGQFYDVNYKIVDNGVDHNPEKTVFTREWGDWGGKDQAIRKNGEAALIKQVDTHESFLNGNGYPDWGGLDACDRMAGYFLWSWNDYARGCCKNTLPSGNVEVDRSEKFLTYWLQSMQSARNPVYGPMVYIASYYTETSSKTINVYSNCDSVKLYQNGTLVDEITRESLTSTVPNIMKKGGSPIFKFELSTFEAGELKAEGILDGAVVETHTVNTPGLPSKMSIEVEERGIVPVADGSDLIPVHFKVVDENGTLIPDYKGNIQISVLGEGELVGKDIPRIGVEDQTVEAGIGYAFIRTTHNAGKISIIATAEGLGSTMEEIETVPYTGVFVEDGEHEAWVGGVEKLETLTKEYNNLALNKTITASSYQSQNAIENAVDDNEETRWCADSGNFPQWIEVDLGEVKDIVGFHTIWEKLGTVYRYTIEVSEDNKEWTKVVNQENNSVAANNDMELVETKARYVRLNIMSAGDYWASLWEFKVLAEKEEEQEQLPGILIGSDEIESIVASCENEPDRGPDKLIDGETLIGTGWLASTTEMPQSVTLQLKESKDLAGSQIYWEKDSSWYTYDLEVSEDGNTWTKALDNMIVGGQMLKPVNFSKTYKNIKYVKVTLKDVVSGSGEPRIGMAELMLYSYEEHLDPYYYLSDLEWESATSEYGSVKKDESVYGGGISLNSENGVLDFDKGISADTYSEIVYDISDKGYIAFESYIGINRTASKNGGEAICTFYIDNKLVYTSPVFMRDDNCIYVKFDIPENAKTLRLEANWNDNKDNFEARYNTHVVWADAKLLTRASIVDKTKLNAEIEKAAQYLEEDYTPESWSIFEQAYAAAKAVAANEGASKSEVEAAIKELQSKIAQLEPVPQEPIQTNKWALSALITYAESQKDDSQYQDVVPVVKRAFEKAIVDAQKVMDTEDVSQEVIDSAYTELLKLVWMLGYTGNTSDLSVVVDVAKEYDLTLYTPQTAQAVRDALAVAEAVLANENALQEEIIEATEALQSAIDALELSVDKTALKNKIDEADEIDLEQFLNVGKEEFVKALADAKVVYDKPDASKEEVENAYKILRNAIFLLRERPDKSKLEDLIKDAQGKDSSKFTEDSFAVLTKALKAAKLVKENKEATPEEVAIAVNNLTKAIKGLEEKPVEVKEGWEKQKDGSWRYQYSDGTFAANKWEFIYGRYYYFNSEGYMVTGWVKVDHKWYYLKSNGAMATGWVKVDQKWYYLKANGAMATGWAKVDQKWYYLKANGAMATGWAKVDEKWYYLKANGVMAVGWVKVDEKWYYLKANGVMARDWVKVSGKWYYLKDNGVMATGWIKVRGTWYYLKKDGSMATNWTFDGKKLYYLNVTNGAWNGQVK